MKNWMKNLKSNTTGGDWLFKKNLRAFRRKLASYKSLEYNQLKLKFIGKFGSSIQVHEISLQIPLKTKAHDLQKKLFG